mmetsp:Transcript_14664/g.22128  ORF Transcript_14664/g.22128 Transcript_14664/m.22128 type:complete len:88 (-) Transcript_14664:40-303(-)
MYSSELLESIKKDVKRTFIILKLRFCMLMNSIIYRNRVFVNDIVRTCASLHNLLLAYDDYDEFELERNCIWFHDNPDMSDDDYFFYV